MELIVNISGIRIHVGFYRDGSMYQVDPVDCYVINDKAEFVSQIDDVDTVGEMTKNHGWCSLRCLAEEQLTADDIARWERDAQRQAIADRRVA